MIFSVEPSFSLIRELLLVKFSTENADVSTLKKIIEDFGANIIDITSGCFVAELSASSQKIDEFLDATSGFDMIELCRSGAIAMERGKVSYDMD